MTNDDIESPSHYSFGMMEAREIIELAIADFRDPTTVYHVASALKYLLRASRKNGADDIAKARKHIVWAEAAARAWIRSRKPPGWDGCTDMSVCGAVIACDGSLRDAGEFTQPPNCSPGVSDPTPPMHAVALEMAEAAIPKRRGESDWAVTWPSYVPRPCEKPAEPQTEYQTLVGN